MLIAGDSTRGVIVANDEVQSWEISATLQDFFVKGWVLSKACFAQRGAAHSAVTRVAAKIHACIRGK